MEPHTVAAIESELRYQEQTAGKWAHKNNPSLEKEMLLMEEYLSKARSTWTTNSNPMCTLDMLRKVVGIGVRCFHNHGVPFRT